MLDLGMNMDILSAGEVSIMLKRGTSLQEMTNIVSMNASIIATWMMPAIFCPLRGNLFTRKVTEEFSHRLTRVLEPRNASHIMQ